MTVQIAELPKRIDPSQNALLLDIDGTLLDIALTPDAVIVPPELMESLKNLQTQLGGALALVSGRSLPSIDRLFGPSCFHAVASQGTEIRDSTGYRSFSNPLPDWVRAFGRDIEAAHPGVLVEDKIFALSIHYRLIPSLGPTVTRLVQEKKPALKQAGIEVLPGKSVIDLKPQSCNKGTGITTLMQTPPFLGRNPIFAGDDVTDLDGLAVLERFGGIGISVGSAMKGAEFMLSTPTELRHWLGTLVI